VTLIDHRFGSTSSPVCLVHLVYLVGRMHSSCLGKAKFVSHFINQ
jgi:hypothetical protein